MMNPHSVHFVTIADKEQLTLKSMSPEINDLSAKHKNNRKFKSFNETFSHCAFSLAISLMYPNKNNLKIRIAFFSALIFINSPLIFWYIMYLKTCLDRSDIYNLIRNLTIGILISLFLFKTCYVFVKNEIFNQLIAKISEDLIEGNEMQEVYQEYYEYYIKIGHLGQTCWTIIPVVLTLQFPLYACVGSIYESLKSDVGKRYMVHEMELLYIEHKQYETPYYEWIFAYCLLQCFVLASNYAGFDGSFCIATTHLRLKLKLIALKLNSAFTDSKDRNELKARVIEVIKDHQEALLFYNLLQNMYGGWLFVIFLLSSLVISLNLVLMYLSGRFDLKCSIFSMSGVILMFAPCYYSSDLTKTGEELSTDIYNVRWEMWAENDITKLLIFMIAKSQQPLILSGMGLVYINMQLFISVLQTSYSVFTLISN